MSCHDSQISALFQINPHKVINLCPTRFRRLSGSLIPHGTTTKWIVSPGPLMNNNQTVFLFDGKQKRIWIYQSVLPMGTIQRLWGRRLVASWLAGRHEGAAF